MRVKRLLAGVVTISTGAVGLLVLSTATPAGALEATVPSNVAPSWQTNGTVTAIAATAGVVYIGGDFTSVRPPGAAAGTGEVARNHLAAFNSSTGALITSFNHNVNAAVKVLSISPNGQTVYAGGDFTSVDGATRNRIFSFTASSGALTSWNPNSNGRVAGISATASTVFVGGSFSTIGGRTERRVAALNATSGAALSTFTTTPDNVIYQIALSPQGDKLYLAGAFLSVNGDTNYHAAAVVDTTTGANLPFAAGSVIPPKTDACIVEAKSVKTDATGAYFGVEGTGGGCFDGTFAVNGSDGSLRWQSKCLGATQSVEVLNGILYSGSHSHDCSGDFGTDPDAFPEIGWSKGLSRHLLSRTVAGGLLSNWYPNTNGGPNGTGLGPRVLATDGSQIFVGGEFTTVNGFSQQGFARFSPATGDLTAPGRPVTPTAVSRTGGKVSIFVQAPLDTDDTDVTVRLYRDGGTTPIAVAPVHSLFWKQPVVAFNDDSLSVGSTHTYTADAIETNGSNAGARSAASRPVTVATTAPSYEASVATDNPSLYWRLGDPSGPVIADSSDGLNGGTSFGAVGYATPGAIAGNTAITTDGASGEIASSKQQASPTTFSVETWFKTTTTSGGKIIGFGDRQGGLDFSGNPALSSSYDKQVYMTNDGHLVLGVYVNGADTVTSSNAYNDGQWHQVVGTQGPLGMTLYVDGAKVAHDGQTQNQIYAGYWRIGGDNVGGWPNQPASNFFAGAIDEAAVYNHVLSLTAIQNHYAASGRIAPASTAPTDAYGKAVYNDGATSFWRLDETSGGSAADATDNGATGNYIGGITQGDAGAIATGHAVRFDGGTGNVTSSSQVGGPSSFAAELWFKTTTTNGGKLIGFGNSQTGNSGNYDKHVYMLNDGRLVFGVYNGGFDTLYTPNGYNDGQWHHVVAEQGSTGMSLYVDDHLAGSNAVSANQGYDGYWRVGGDNLGAWPDRPNSDYFAGTIDEIAIYASPLTATQVDGHYLASGRSGPDAVAPATSITAPSDGSTTNSGDVTVTATASDNVAVTSVALQVDGATVDSSTATPYTFTWHATDGPHTLRTIAHDAASNTGVSDVVNVNVVTPDTTAPTTAITSPAAGDSVYGPTTVTATASDDVGVSSVALQVDGVTVETDNTAPYTFSWNATTVGPHTLRTIAVDSANNSGQSAEVGVVVPADTTAPTASITSPDDGASAYGPTTVTATAADDRGVASVDLLIDGSVVATDGTAPYTFNWAATVVGTHTVDVVAHDAASNTGNSASITVTVPQDTIAPSAPGSLTSSAESSTSATLSWTASTDDRSLAGYKVVRNGSVLPGTVTALSYTDLGLTAGATYSYVVRAVDATGNLSSDSDTVLVTTPVANPVLFSETWPGADGTAWPSAWTASNSNGAVDSQAGAGRISMADVANAYGRTQLTGLAARADSDLVTSFTWSSNTAVSYLSIYVRGSGGWQNGYRPKSGYGLEFQSNSGTVAVRKTVNGTTSTIQSVPGAQLVSTTKQWLRVRVSGSTIQFKTWADGAAEPTAWKSTNSDSTVTAPGQVFISLNRGTSNVGGKSVSFDDLSIRDAQ